MLCYALLKRHVFLDVLIIKEREHDLYQQIENINKIRKNDKNKKRGRILYDFKLSHDNKVEQVAVNLINFI